MNQSPPVRAMPDFSLRRPIAIGVVILLALGVIASGGFNRNAPGASEPRVDPAAQLLEDYGGSRAAYDRIFSLTDCGALIREHDIALTNEAREVKGTSAAYVAHGYGRAAAQRLIELNC